MRPIFLVLAVCLISACLIHASDIWRRGWLPYRFAPLPLNIYWTSLAFFDALAALLLLCLPRIGLVVTLIIIVSDVAVNLFARFSLGLHLRSLFLSLQIIFLIVTIIATVYSRRSEALTQTI